MDSLITRQTSLSGNVILLGRYLRSKGYNISSSEESDAMRSLSVINLKSEYQYWNTLRAVFSKNKYQYENFEDHYKSYQHEMKKAVDSKVKTLSGDKKKPVKSKTPSIEALKSWLYNQPQTDEVQMSSFSNVEVLVKKDFAQMDQDEMRLILQVLRELAAKILRKKSRSKKISRRHSQIDLRQTLRQNLRSGTDINDIVWSEKKIKKLKLVLLCDVSRSMDLYSRFFIQMIYAFHKGSDRIETFVFSTALHQVTDLLTHHDYDQALDKISKRVPQWSGGTKIGTCLDRFFSDHGHHMLDRKTVTIILSDGWDTGEESLMKDAMKSIYKSSRKVLWLNPLAGHPDFEPEVIGLKNVLPYINGLHAAHNLVSLKKVLALL